ncbi:MAG: hypothetical protein M9888_12330 [Chitinophagales bacterium]|nr:hypothetical protein [Chitinophagales bacterium]
MKKIHKPYLISVMVFLTVIVGCKKDVHQNIINPPKVYNENADIRVLKVQFKGKGITGRPPLPPERIINYQYDKDNLKKIKLELPTKGVMDYVNIVYGEHGIEFYNRQKAGDVGWEYTHVNINDRNQVEDIKIWTPVLPHVVHYTTEAKIHIERDKDGMLRRVGILREHYDNDTYAPINTHISSYNTYGLPEKSVAEKTWYFTAVLNHTFDFEFEYVRAEDIPSQLKRLVNEELLYLNRYGVINFEEYKIAGINIWHPLSVSGEGNWLVSFGLPQYHILEDKSSYIVSKRNTIIYKYNEVGEKEYERTIVEDFPYKHDAEAKTLEIAGLKIWYEYVEEK